MIGTVLNNTYRLEHALTEGGMGQVFVASHLRIKGRKYAIKQLRPELATAPNFQTRFQVEAEVMMELEHPHIVRIEDFLVQDNAYYLVMEFIEGYTLDGRLSQFGAMETDEVHRLAIELLHGLEYCHQKGVIHRDLKPSNILLTKDNVLKLTDFGIALQENTDKRLTRTGTILGTPDYMSPEQIMSYPLDGRSDIYSTGIILYEMSAGLPPFLRSHDTGGSYQILFAHVHRPAPDLDKAKIPAYLRKAIERSIEKDPAHRFASAQEMIDFLEEARAEEGLPPVLHGTMNRQTPSQSMSTFVPGEEPQPPAQSGDLLEATSAISHDAVSAASLDAAPAVKLNETAPTPANSETSSLSQSAAPAASPAVTGKRRWPMFLMMAFLAGVCGMLSWWMIEPESFAQFQKLVEQKTGLKAPIPAYTKRANPPRRPTVLTPRRQRTAPRTKVRNIARNITRNIARRAADIRAGAPRVRAPQRRAVADTRTPAPRPRQRPDAHPRARVVVPWPVPLAPERRQPTIPRRVVPRRDAPRVAPPRRPTTPRAAKRPKVDVPLWGYRAEPPARPRTRVEPRRPKPVRPVPVKRDPVKRDPVRRAPAPRRRAPVEPLRPMPARPTPLRREPIRPVPLRRNPGAVVPRVAPRPIARRQVAPLKRDPIKRDPVPPAPLRRDPVQPKPPRREPLAPPRRSPVRPAPVRPRALPRVIPPRVIPRRVAPRRVVPPWTLPRRVVPRRVAPRQVIPRRVPLPPRRLPAPRRPKSQPWPLPVSGQCAKLLQVCVRTCLQQRESTTPAFLAHCKSECWRTRIIQYKKQKICPPSPPAPKDAPSEQMPPRRRKISL